MLTVLRCMIVVSIIFAVLAVPAARADVVYVDAGAAGNDDGTSWQHAFNDLQEALAEAGAGDEIWVAAGLYYPTHVAGNRTASFQLIDGVALYGGFPPGGGELSDRDWQVHVTVLSGDIDGNDVTDANGVVTDPDDIVGGNSYQVVTGHGTDGSAVLDGFHITAGWANGGNLDNRGAGLYNDNGSPTVNNIVFTGNRSVIGGGMSNVDSSPALANVRFVNNQGSAGAGMYNWNSSPSLNNVSFIGNRTSANANGGGMANNSNSNPTLNNVSFIGNQAAANGGGMFNNIGSSPILTNVSFIGNQAINGGGMLNSNGSNPTLINVSFSGNRAYFNDVTTTSGGGMYNGASSPTLINVIFWNNRAGTAANTTSASIFNVGGSSPSISWSLVANCNPGGSWRAACGTNGGNNRVDADPLFVDTPDPGQAPTGAGNLRLRPGSPAIDAGHPAIDPGLFPGGPGDPVDLDNLPRFLSDAIDLGPYEYSGPVLRFDPAALNFGEVIVGQTSTPQFITLHNSAAAGVVVDLPINGPFTADTHECDSELSSGSSCQISVVFTPPDSGEMLGSLEAGDSGHVLARLQLSGIGVYGMAEISPLLFDFRLNIGGSAGDVLNIGNRGDVDLIWSIDTRSPGERGLSGCDGPVGPAWLSVAPDAGVTMPGGNVPVAVVIEADGLAPGSYSALLCVTTNDPDLPLAQVAVDLTVAPDPVPVLEWNHPGAGSWFDAGNWSPQEQPDAGYRVRIDNGGAAIVSNPGAAADSIGIGWFGTGTLGIINGGTLTVEAQANFGVLAAGEWGFMEVNDAGSSLTVNGDLRAAVLGNSAINVRSGGTVTVAQSSVIGPGQGFALVVMEGSGSSWTTDRFVFGGSSGSPSVLNLRNGAMINTDQPFELRAFQAGNDPEVRSILSVGSGGAPGILNAPAVIGGSGFSGSVGTALLEIFHDDGDYHFTRDGSADGAAVGITDGAAGKIQVRHIGVGTTTLSGDYTHGGDTEVIRGTLRVRGGSIQSPGALVTVGPANVINPGARALDILDGGTITGMTGAIGHPGGHGTVTVDGAGSRWSTSEQLTLRNGELTVADGGAVEVGSAIPMATTATATAVINIGAGGEAGTVAAASISGGAGTAEINFNHTGAGFAFTDDGTEQGQPVPIAGSTAVNHLGSGTTVLLGNHSYSGGTRVDAGTLRINGSIIGDTVVNVGGTLGGTGSAGHVTVAAGGVLAPGGSAGTFTVDALSLSGNAVLDYELGAPGVAGGGVNDLIVVGGDLVLDGIVEITDIGGFGHGVYTLMTYEGGLSDNGLVVGPLPEPFSAAINLEAEGEVRLVVSAGPMLAFSPPALDFGTIALGSSSAALTTILQNTGDGAATGLDFVVPAGFTADTAACGDTLPGGQSCQVDVIFTPLAVGPADEILSVDSSEGAAAALALSANGVQLGDAIFPDRFENRQGE